MISATIADSFQLQKLSRKWIDMLRKYWNTFQYSISNKKIAYNRNTEGKKWAVCVILTAKPSRRRIIFKKLQSWSSYYSHEICYRALSHIAYMGPSAITINSRLLFSNNFRFLFTNKEATTTTKIQISIFPLKTRFFYFLFLSHFLTLIMPNSIRFSDIQWILVWDK